MKRVFTVIVVTVMATMGFNSTATAQVEQGNIIVDPYVGFPTLNAIKVTQTLNDNFGTVGPPVSFGIRGEYMAADNFGVGLDVNYAISGYKYTEKDHLNEETGLYADAEYKYTAKRFRGMVRLNYHFTQSSQLDAYIGVGAGYRNVQRNVYYDNVKVPSVPFTLIPVAFRIALGGRYYFTDNIGAMLELGLGGGGLIQFGVSIKI